MATKSKSEPDWSTLPTCLLSIIGELLHSRVDTLYLRAVCRSFRSSVTLSRKPSIPFPNLRVPAAIISGAEPFSDPEPVSDHESFSDYEPELEPGPSCLTLKQSVFYAIELLTEASGVRENTETWILRVEELDSNRVSFKKPFCGEDYWEKSLRSLNLLDYRVKVMGRVYRLDFDSEYDYFDFDFHEIESRKVVASDDGSAGMALLCNDKLVVWRNGDEDWTRIDDIHYSVDEPCGADIIYHKGKFYAVYPKDNLITDEPRSVLIAADAKSLVVTEIGYHDPPFRAFGHSKYLVKSSNDLFSVVKYFNSYEFDCEGEVCVDTRSFKFCVSKFDEEKNEFVPTKNAFENRVVFVGKDFAFTVSAEEFPGLKRNCIYLNDDAFGNHYEDYDFYGDDYFPDEVYDFHGDELFSDEDDDNGVMFGLNVGVYDLRKDTSLPLDAVSDVVFWPPPTWVKSCSGPSSR